MEADSEYDRRQKEKARKRTRSGKRKTVQTGSLCNIFTAFVYWDPTHRCLEGAMHLPKGTSIPDVNEFLRNFPKGQHSPKPRAERASRRVTRSQALQEIVVSTSDEEDRSSLDTPPIEPTLTRSLPIEAKPEPENDRQATNRNEAAAADALEKDRAQDLTDNDAMYDILESEECMAPSYGQYNLTSPSMVDATITGPEESGPIHEEAPCIGLDEIRLFLDDRASDPYGFKDIQEETMTGLMRSEIQNMQKTESQGLKIQRVKKLLLGLREALNND